MTADPLIAAEVDTLVDIIEASGANWHVIGGSSVIGPYLVFSPPAITPDTMEIVKVIKRFDILFRTNVEVRQAVIEYAISVGAYYVEIGCNRPVVSDGETVQ